MLLMCGNIPVMSIDVDNLSWEIFDSALLPWQLKGAIRKMPGYEDYQDTASFIRQQTLTHTHNYQALIAYLSGRVLSLSRENAKWLYHLIGASQTQDEVNKAKISLLFRSVSLLDKYWIKKEDDSRMWEDVDLHVAHLNEIFTQVALRGASLTLTGDWVTPEFSTFGTYAKAWVREEDGLYLYKAGFRDSTESRIEAEVSHILDLCNVEHLHYEMTEYEGIQCCKCKCMTTEQISMLHAEDYYTYCNQNDLNFEQEVLKLDADNYYKMWIVDYLIANRDRHGQNWGFFYEPSTMKLLGCHPLYDHNNSFDREYMDNPDSVYPISGRSLQSSAEYARKKVDFYFKRKPVREDFLTERHFKLFMKRANNLGIQVLEN